MNDPYSVLGLQRGASEQEAKEAFRKLAKTCHPDLHPNNAQAEQRFKEINAAYDAIRNPQPDPTVNVSWQFRQGPFAGGGFEDIFADMFGHQRRNSDAAIDYRLTLEEAFQGKKVSLSIPVNSRNPRTIEVSIPPGIAHGMRVRVPQGGHHTNPGMIAGDLYLVISVLNHDRFTRQGANLIVIAPVTIFDVMLCKDVDIIGIDGSSLRVSIPGGFDSRRLRVAGHGMPDPYSGARGDLLVELFIQYPVLNEQQQSLIQQAAAAQ